jgi:hypothetical protein
MKAPPYVLSIAWFPQTGKKKVRISHMKLRTMETTIPQFPGILSHHTTTSLLKIIKKKIFVRTISIVRSYLLILFDFSRDSP